MKIKINYRQRAIRNKNLGNLRVGSPWLGLVDSDNGFCVFDSFAHGIRALVKLIRTYKRRGWLSSPDVFARHYAPAGDGSNNPSNYADFVSRAWDYTELPIYHSLPYFIIWMETGYNTDDLSETLFNDSNKIMHYIRLS